MASLIKAEQDGDLHACGASVVSRTHVVTAAHCVTDENGVVEDHTRWRVRVGSAQWRSGGLVTAVAAVDVFDAWHGFNLNPPDRHGDLALLRLSTAVNVAPFPLASSVGMSTPTRLIGWGIEVDDRRPLLSTGDGPPAETLHEIDGMTAAATGCAAIWITDAELCVAFDGPGSCGGDSGSPALQKVDGRWRLVGVLSHAYFEVPRCEMAFPATAFTDLTDPDHRAWIVRIACAGTLTVPRPCQAPGRRPTDRASDAGGEL